MRRRRTAVHHREDGDGRHGRGCDAGDDQTLVASFGCRRRRDDRLCFGCRLRPGSLLRARRRFHRRYAGSGLASRLDARQRRDHRAGNAGRRRRRRCRQEHESIGPDCDRFIERQRVDLDAALLDPDTVLAVQVEDDVAPLFVADFRVHPGDALVGVLEHDLVLGSAADSHRTLAELHLPQELFASIHRESGHLIPPCAGYSTTVAARTTAVVWTARRRAPSPRSLRDRPRPSANRPCLLRSPTPRAKRRMQPWR